MNVLSKLSKMLREIAWGGNHRRRSSPLSILFNSLGYVRGLLLLARFEKDLQQASHLNLRTLREIINLNRESEFGRQYGFATLDLNRTDATYKATVPLHKYSDYESA